MSEAESTALAVREVYSAYHSEMGGVGAAPEPKARTPTTDLRVQRRPKPQPSLSDARRSTRPMTRKSIPALLIFASMAALIIACSSNIARGLCTGTKCLYVRDIRFAPHSDQIADIAHFAFGPEADSNAPQ